MALAELAETGADIDVLRQIVQVMATLLMEINVQGCGGADYDVKSSELHQQLQRLPPGLLEDTASGAPGRARMSCAECACSALQRVSRWTGRPT